MGYSFLLRDITTPLMSVTSTNCAHLFMNIRQHLTMTHTAAQTSNERPATMATRSSISFTCAMFPLCGIVNIVEKTNTKKKVDFYQHQCQLCNVFTELDHCELRY